jgi:hypothetical protein
VTLFRAAIKNIDDYSDSAHGWRPVSAGGIAIHEVPGDHATMLAEPHVEELARKLQPYLRQPASNGAPGDRALTLPSESESSAGCGSSVCFLISSWLNVWA